MADDYFTQVAQLEAGGSDDPNLRSRTSSATGPYQITGPTFDGVLAGNPDLPWTTYDKNNPDAQRAVMQRLTEGNGKGLKASGFEDNDAHKYVAHNLGLPSALKVLRADPNTPMTSLLSPDAVRANPGVFDNKTAGNYLTGIRGRFGGKMDPNELEMQQNLAAEAAQRSQPAPPAMGQPQQPNNFDFGSWLRSSADSRDKAMVSQQQRQDAMFAALKQELAGTEPKQDNMNEFTKLANNFAIGHAGVAPSLYATKGGILTRSLPNAQDLAMGPQAMNQTIRENESREIEAARRKGANALTMGQMKNANSNEMFRAGNELENARTQSAMQFYQIQQTQGQHAAQMALEVSKTGQNAGAQSAIMGEISKLPPGASSADIQAAGSRGLQRYLSTGGTNVSEKDKAEMDLIPGRVAASEAQRNAYATTADLNRFKLQQLQTPAPEVNPMADKLKEVGLKSFEGDARLASKPELSAGLAKLEDLATRAATPTHGFGRFVSSMTADMAGPGRGATALENTPAMGQELEALRNQARAGFAAVGDHPNFTAARIDEMLNVKDPAQLARNINLLRREVDVSNQKYSHAISDPKFDLTTYNDLNRAMKSTVKPLEFEGADAKPGFGYNDGPFGPKTVPASPPSMVGGPTVNPKHAGLEVPGFVDLARSSGMEHPEQIGGAYRLYGDYIKNNKMENNPETLRGFFKDLPMIMRVEEKRSKYQRPGE